MENIIIINASPRAPQSNSKKYAEIFSKHSRLQTEYFELNKRNQDELINKIEEYSQLLFVFPLYADGLPAPFLDFLKMLERALLKHKPIVSILINCGFIEHSQNDIAVEMIKLFCNQNEYIFGSVLKIGAGEAILETPFKKLVEWKIKKLASSICTQEYKTLEVSMPISKKTYISKSTEYWVKYGQKYNVSKEEMESMKIE
ncbi:hypothetical protein AN639_07625 [Candidatus Epulonipiscium fishelsonii]|uniref:Uncharacterized protein n=1 Tax=Candidatus Epulonipiscium fishelsonii TaxID=77094 RepID=A0ACC8XEG9_9FIRM|nr:hypothetical protein AN639_07625 [Epulopiscium sp. SCG-B05WGA-EpuloA1]ONI41492.1 hypothetical protein AN396_03540 [Epulopiscium sp. SCG-B11WGA-EpuloA1]